MSESLRVFDVGAVLTPFDRFSPGRLFVRGNRVEAVGLLSDVRVPGDADHVKLPHLTLVPGFIEPHIHGCGGVDVMDATPNSMATICRTLAKFGTTSFLPTTVSAPVATLSAAVKRLASLLSMPFDGAQPLGIHLEGPFINPSKRGTHRSDNVCSPDATLLSKWVGLSNGMIRLLTMAPELEGAAAVADLARVSGIHVGMGHSDASCSEAKNAADRGTRYAVHTFNAMRPMNHRDPGIVGTVLSDDRIFAEIIADGVHVAPEVVRIFARAKGPSRILLATDATSATGMPDGTYALGKSQVQVTGGICRDAEGRLAGSTLTQDQALRNLILWSGMRLDDAVLSLSANPAEALSLEGRGRLEPGYFADFTALDATLRVIQTYVAGKLAFEVS